MTQPPPPGPRRSTSGSWQEPDVEAESSAPWWVAGHSAAPPAHPAPPPPPGPARRRTGLLVLAAVLLVLAVVAALLGTGGDGAVTPAAPSPTAPVATRPAPAKQVAPTRLKALPPAVAGTGGFVQLAYDGKPGDARWDPCRPIRYVTRARSAPPGGAAVVRRAFDQLSAATGLVFVDAGATTEGPSGTRPAKQARYGPGYAPVLVTWSTAKEAADLKGRVDGFAGAQPADPDGKGLRLVTGEVTLDAPAFRRYPSAFQLEIVLHELGHLVGLDHVGDRDDIMYFESDGAPARTRYTTGARRGLRVAGQGRCFG